VPVRLRHEHRSYKTGIEGIPPDAYLRRIIDKEFHPISIPQQGIVLTDRLGEILHAAPGDEIVVEVLEGHRRTRRVPVVGLTKQYIGMAAYMELRALNRLVGGGDAISGVYMTIDLRHEPELVQSLRSRPRVASIVAQNRAIAAFMETAAQSMLTFTYVLTLFAGIIAFGVVYNSARIALSERDRELASLRVLGFTRGEIAYILLGELAVIVLISLPIGFGLGAALSAFVVAGVQTDLYEIPLVLSRGTFALAAVVVLASALVSAFIVRLKLNKLDLIGVLKTRE
jgi:putative ABC transport system permease protein